MKFRRFIAVDWSGAKDRGRGLKGLQVATCGPDLEAPEPKPNRANSRNGRWRRCDFANWLKQEAADGPVLVGLDFCFALPFCDKDAYFPEADVIRGGVFELWATVDAECASEPDFYGGPIWRSRTSRISDYFNGGAGFGARYSPRFRKTERVTRDCQGTRPVSAFNCVGPSVGAGSLAGMRFLHEVRRWGVARVWPFEPLDSAPLVLVEIFPQVFLKKALRQTAKVRDASAGNEALKFFGSRPTAQPPDGKNAADAWDALISAAALRHLARDEKLWCPKAMTPDVARREGWIFGVE